MNEVWAVCLERGDERRLAALRGFAGLEVAECGPALWLLARRAASSMEARRLSEGKPVSTLADASGFHAFMNQQGDGDEALDLALRMLPGKRYRVLADGQLVAEGQRVPRGWLPEAPWTPLAHWLHVKLPAAALPGRIGRRVALQLVRTTDEQRPTAMMTTLDAWTEYCTSAAEVRLRPLAFAVSDDRRVVITGAPLPPLPGDRFVVCDGVAIPCGFELQPRMSGPLLRGLLELDHGDVALFAADGTFERMAHDQWVAANRAAARATAAAFGERRHD